MYVKSISDNLVPEDFQDLKIIKKGEGTNFIKDLYLGNGNSKELKASIEYHKQFLESCNNQVVLNDFDYLKGSQAFSKSGTPVADSKQATKFGMTSKSRCLG